MREHYSNPYLFLNFPMVAKGIYRYACQILKVWIESYFTFDACMPILTRLKQKMRDSPYAVGMPLAFAAWSSDTCETPDGSRQPGAAWVALFPLVRARLAAARGSRPTEITIDFAGKLVGYVHCTRTALSYPDWCGSCAVDNLGTNGS